MEKGERISSHHWNSNEIELINTFGLLSAKPVVYLLNVSEADYMNKKFDGYIIIWLNIIRNINIVFLGNLC